MDKKNKRIPEGVFISPLDDPDALFQLEEEEKKILGPSELSMSPETPSASSIPDAEHPTLSPIGIQGEVDTQSPYNSFAFPEPSQYQNEKAANQEDILLRLSAELKSIKQDLVKIRNHIDAFRKDIPITDVTNSAQELPETTDHANDLSIIAAQLAETQSLLKDIKSLLLYLDQLLESLPENKIEEFANSEYFNLYRSVFEKLGIS